MPLRANIPSEWISGIEEDRMLIVFPSWSKKDKVSYLVIMNMKTRALVCECLGFQHTGDCHHVRLLVFCCAGPRKKSHGVQPTSVEAFRAFTPGMLAERQRMVLKVLEELGKASNKQLSRVLGWPINCVTPRVKELRELALVDYAGEQFDQKTQRHEMIWETV
jgi:hypothetical protein